MHVSALSFDISLLIANPLERVRADLMARLNERFCYIGVALYRCSDRKYSQRDIFLSKQTQQAPDSGPAAVFIDRFHAHVALSRKSDGRRHLRKECFRLAIGVKDTALSTLFVVE